MEQMQQTLGQKRNITHVLDADESSASTARRRLLDEEELQFTTNSDASPQVQTPSDGTPQTRSDGTPLTCSDGTPASTPPLRRDALQRQTNAFSLMCAAAKASGSSVSREFFESMGKMAVNLFLRECVSRKVDIDAVRPFGNVTQRSYTQRGRKVYKPIRPRKEWMGKGRGATLRAVITA